MKILSLQLNLKFQLKIHSVKRNSTFRLNKPEYDNEYSDGKYDNKAPSKSHQSTSSLESKQDKDSQWKYTPNQEELISRNIKSYKSQQHNRKNVPKAVQNTISDDIRELSRFTVNALYPGEFKII